MKKLVTPPPIEQRMSKGARRPQTASVDSDYSEGDSTSTTMSSTVPETLVADLPESPSMQEIRAQPLLPELPVEFTTPDETSMPLLGRPHLDGTGASTSPVPAHKVRLGLKHNPIDISYFEFFSLLTFLGVILLLITWFTGITIEYAIHLNARRRGSNAPFEDRVRRNTEIWAADMSDKFAERYRRLSTVGSRRMSRLGSVYAPYVRKASL